MKNNKALARQAGHIWPNSSLSLRTRLNSKLIRMLNRKYIKNTIFDLLTCCDRLIETHTNMQLA